MRPLAVLRHDVPASLVVFLVAVPLSLGIALASGAPIVAGLIAAVVGGVVAGALGGSALQVSGPAAGLTVIMAETIDTFGWRVTCLITVAAGALQVLLGLSRIARAALAISPAIVHGMLAGIGVTIVLGQLHVILGGKAQSSAIENVAELPAQIVAHHDAAAVIGLFTIAVLLLWPRLPAAVRKVPGPLAAIALATVVSVVAGMTLPRVELPGDLLRIRFAPELPGGGWADVAVAAVTIALIASVESLLSAVAVDKLHTGPRANLDRELVGQGAANLVSGALGGLPVTGVIVRSSTNVAAGAQTRASAVLHGVWVLLFVVALAGLIQNIPLAALAGLLVHVGAKLVNPGHLRQVLRHGDLVLYLVTLAGVVVFDLLTGVVAGIVLALLLMLRRTVWSGIRAEREGEHWRVVVEGVLTFLSVPRLSKVLGSVPEGTTVTLELIVDYLDHASFESLVSWQQAHERAGGTVVVDEVGHPWLAKGRAGSPTLRRTGAAGSVPRWLAPWSDWQAADVHGSGPCAHPTRRGTTEFQRRAAPLLRETLSGLADGQRPHTMFITCGDSRIVPNLITTSGPGDLFTIRNIGNLVPPAQADPSMNAAVEFAVGVLGVREIVVCGHSACGAMGALAEGPPPGTALETWLGHAGPSKTRRGPVTLDGERPAREPDRLALHNVLQQLDHLRQYPMVAEAEHSGALVLTGLYFDVGAAQVWLAGAEDGAFFAAGTPAVARSAN
ncbi:bifunctional SulP family inorganic anion transporter/carbonic anhydrase [Amycolatopsis sp. PS_44_ISF1]|uniref:bifunctional SulP family inorganic anion transporter/carbonic anhydrase n=1 Tax=Amycolatopsis sp. PS_44_ISF1 TaxID=2974917 RepID=UPI0028DF2AB6|nr:bifunctional SulP family inorganic anion transporter/carbonic anhydrase [Amycolatopsis sp. PS_44_ISF1]MDT8914379.1 bifunctional SulP family inorganic anion transporter/carbonic anhydrase [Amycolatopsis sp. PS_44_ISF1]